MPKASWVLVVAALLSAGSASANMAKLSHDGDGYAPLVPQNDTDVRVDSEDLSFVVGPTLGRAAVTATYRMTSAAATSVDVAFVLACGEEEHSPEASITVDAVPVVFRVVTDADVLGPALDAWLAVHPQAESEMARLASADTTPSYPDLAALRRQVPGCNGEQCNDLLRWYRQRKDPTDKHTIANAAEVAIPEQVAKLHKDWSGRGDRRLSWLAFALEFAAGATRTVTVRYEHVSGEDLSSAVNPTFTYDYLLSPGKRWARFGPLHLTLQLPPGTRLQSSSLPLKEDGNGYRADFSALPDRDLSFEIMSQKGLVFGMTQPTGYWLMLIAAMGVVTILLAQWLGRKWRGAGWLRVFGTFLVVGGANALLVVLGSAAFPAGAFGLSYGAAFGLLGLPVLFTVIGIVISVRKT